MAVEPISCDSHFIYPPFIYLSLLLHRLYLACKTGTEPREETLDIDHQQLLATHQHLAAILFYRPCNYACRLFG